MENNINYIDLDLPSGTLWADRNLGAKKLYTPGILSPWPCKKFSFQIQEDIIRTSITGMSDIITRLLGIEYSLPTKEDCEELFKHTDKSVNNCGMFFYSKKNAKKNIFIPFNGYYNSFCMTERQGISNAFFVWTSTKGNGKAIYTFCGTKDGHVRIDSYEGFYGHTIRTIKKNNLKGNK